MQQPAHTPYDGSAKPFTIGLKPLDLHDWIEVDALLSEYLAEKDRLYAEIPEKVFMAEPGTEESQREVLDALAGFLPGRFPETYRRDGSGIMIGGPDGPDRIVRLDSAEPPLKTASRLVQEDLVLMRRSEEGWRLAAASLCFPSSWSLAEKFGKPIQEIHRPVPDFGPGTRSAELIERMFDRLQGQAVWRLNWSLAVDPSLYLPLLQVERKDRAAGGRSRFPGADPAASAFIRVERQTLRKMPRSGDILFTIRIHVDPMRVLASHPQRSSLAASFADQLDALTEAQLAYKGLHNDRNRLVAALRAMV
jgi:dimethylamine monooxygenase subunit A